MTIDLRESRKRAQEIAWLRYLYLLNGPRARQKAFVARFFEGHEEYSAAVVDYLLLQMEKVDSDRQALSPD